MKKRPATLVYFMYKNMEKRVYKSIHFKHLRPLCNMYKKRKMFLTRKALSMRERFLLRIDTGVWITKGCFNGLFC